MDRRRDASKTPSINSRLDEVYKVILSSIIFVINNLRDINFARQSLDLEKSLLSTKMSSLSILYIFARFVRSASKVSALSISARSLRLD